MEHETVWTLLTDPAHWAFELFAEVLFGGIIGALIWPRIKRLFKHHADDDARLDNIERRLQMLEK